MRQELTGNIIKHKCVTLLGAPGDTAPGGTCLPLPPPPPPPTLATLLVTCIFMYVCLYYSYCCKFLG